jgi:hypothetical protein
MLHPRGHSTGNNPDVIPSAKATKGSALETAQRLSHQPRATEDRIAALMRSVIGIAGFMLAIVSPTIASAATIEEVAHCRAIPQLAERLNCFKSLKPGSRAKTEDAALAKKQDAGSSKVKDGARAKAKQVAPAKREQAAPAKKQDAGSSNGQNTRQSTSFDCCCSLCLFLEEPRYGIANVFGRKRVGMTLKKQPKLGRPDRFEKITEVLV